MERSENMRPLCVVFSDAFAFASYSKLEELNLDNKLYKLTPGIAYSSNLHYQIFQGKGPDDLGVFTDFAYDMHSQEIKSGKLARFLDTTRPINDLYRFIYRKTTKRSDNIPFSERKAFVHKGSYLFMQHGECVVFGRQCEKAYEATVEQSFQKAAEFLENGAQNIVVVLEELDRQGHVVGCSGREYMTAADSIVRQTERLFGRFLEKYPDGVYMLISDHGMADVHTGVNVTDYIYRICGLPGKDYFFFNDSVYLRFWSKDREKLERIRAAMEKCEYLVYLDDVQREEFGAADKQFGDLLYRLKQGYVFDPSCFGITGHAICAGMHGYMEHSDEASGIVVTNMRLGERKEIGANIVYREIIRYLENNNV